MTRPSDEMAAGWRTSARPAFRGLAAGPRNPTEVPVTDIVRRPVA